MRGIDLYSGIGGWALGFRAAGAEVVRSYEIWPTANRTHGLNHGTVPSDTDIRGLDLAELPQPGSLEFVIGSPPCTQFSFSNRGGSGDVADGLVDIRKFLEVVQYLRPTRWAMENVPRVAEILKRELAPGGGLSCFADMVSCVLVVDASEFGLPQRRKRMLAGDFDPELLLSYRVKCTPKSLGQVLEGLSRPQPFDPNWGDEISLSQLTDHVREAPLAAEEERMNREAKTHHPVYNRMSFPDRLDRPARTVTATCTRVSRESIVVAEEGGFRRLTVRERAVLQGFPIGYQFAAGSYADRAKMVGNAIPPVLTYYVAHAMKGTSREDLIPLEKLGYRHRAKESAESAAPERASGTYPAGRSFRFAVPGLRFHSGVRFELRNRFEAEITQWTIDFYYGNSKRIVKADLTADAVCRGLDGCGMGWIVPEAHRLLRDSLDSLWDLSGDGLQGRWSNREAGEGPFFVIDCLGVAAGSLASSLANLDPVLGSEVVLKLFPGFSPTKSRKHWPQVLAGAATACVVRERWGSPEGASQMAEAS